MSLIKHITTITAIVFTFIAYSCGSSSDDSPLSDIKAQLKNNKWTHQEVSGDVSDSDPNHAWVDNEFSTIYFTTDNSGIYYWTQHAYDSALGNHLTSDYYLFSYTVSGNTIFLSLENGLTITLNYRQSYLEDGEIIYQAAKMNSSDYDLIRGLGPVAGPCGQGLIYSFNNKTKTLIIEGEGEMTNFAKGGQPWNSFGPETVIIKNGVTSIGDNAFNDLGVATLNLTACRTLKRIGKNAFYNCFLTAVTLPETLETIDDGAFAQNTYLKSVTGITNSNIAVYGSDLFLNCKNLKLGNITFSGKTREIRDRAFMGNNLGNITFTEGVTTIGATAFAGGISNKELQLPATMENIGSVAFVGAFSKIIIGGNLSYIGKNAFSSSTVGGLYINQSTPPTSDKSIVGDKNWDSNSSMWALYVPKGSKSAYSKQSPWNLFKIIQEDASLSGSNSDNDNDNDNDNNGDWEEIHTYKIDGISYKMIYVERNSEIPYSFWIMQTELPADSYLTVGDALVKMDANNTAEKAVTKTEFRNFLSELRNKTLIPFRLPTRKEWQYAASGGKQSKGYTYSGSNNLADVGWYLGNSNRSQHAVALKEANELGLYDMSGNYAELCNEEDDIYFVDGPFCGGSWKDAMSDCKVISWKKGITSGTVSGSRIKEKNSFDGKYIAVRLVYTAKNQ